MTLTNTTVLDERMSRKEPYWRTLNLPAVERKKMMEEEAWTVIRSHWPIVVKQSLQGLLRTCIGTGAGTFKTALTHDPGSFQLLLWGTILPLFQIVLYWILAAYGLFSASKPNVITKTALSLIVLTLICSLLPSAMPLGYARFRTHAAPLLCVLAAIGLAAILKYTNVNLTLTGFRKVTASN